MQPVQVPRNNAVPEAADGDEEGQATSQDKGAELDKFRDLSENCERLHVGLDDGVDDGVQKRGIDVLWMMQLDNGHLFVFSICARYCYA